MRGVAAVRRPFARLLRLLRDRYRPRCEVTLPGGPPERPVPYPPSGYFGETQLDMPPSLARPYAPHPPGADRREPNPYGGGSR